MPFDIKTAASLMISRLSFPPAVLGWNRLEGRPRTEKFDRALRAEVHDALWFVTRQWQFGEFKGEDAGSPVDVRTAVRVDPIQHYAVRGGGAVAYDGSIPLEAHVEREPVSFTLNVHAQITRYFWQLIKGVATPSAVQVLYLTAYPLSASAIAGFPDEDTKHSLQLAKSRVLDTAKLLADLTTGLHDTNVDSFGGLSIPDKTKLKTAGQDLRRWFLSQFSQPADPTDDAWNNRFLEYQFAVATDTTDRGQTVLLADQYAQGHLDWFAFDVDGADGAHLERKDGTVAVPTSPSVVPLSFVPAPVSFGGMPSPRYWEMESRQIEFADIDANTTDVAKLLLTEFALVYGNDWCVIPYELPVGTLTEVTGMLVGDDFGEQSLLLPAGRGLDDQWQRWSMFTMGRAPTSGVADNRFFLPPAVAKIQEAPPLEKVHFLRDEMANMAWAIERVVPSGLGWGINGYVVAAEEAQVAPTPPPLHPTAASVRYILGTDVPYNWFPFIPVHVPGSSRSVQLQRARMPGAARVRRTAILNPPTPYYINEEEVPRAGKIVTATYKRSRWLDGTTITWVGRRVTTGKGEGSSGLAFDQIAEIPSTNG